MCGIFGIYGHKDAASLTYLGLYALQHRGEESAGIASFGKKGIQQHQGMGLVNDLFDAKSLKALTGDVALGHVRYSTTGSSTVKNIQPFLVKHKGGHIAIAHNGNLTNAAILRKEMEKGGSIFQSSMDSEIIIHLLAKIGKRDYRENLPKALSQLEGAFSVIMMIDGALIGARDSFGIRPLCLGKLDDAYVLASETCALDLIHAKYIRDIKPGEVVCIDKNGLTSTQLKHKTRCAHCIFEFIYFSRPDSDIYGENVYLARKRLGQQLAKESPVKADIVMPIPDSGNYAALGFAEESGLPFEAGMIRNHYVGRTFIQPTQHIRDFRVRIKLNPIKNVLKGKRVVIVEDSIVRGTTSKSRVKTLREAGAKEIHMRVSCPPIISPCYYGIDFPTEKELIASSRSVKQIRDFIGLDSLKYLSLDGMLNAMPLPRDCFCAACFSKDYPVKFSKHFKKNLFEETE